MTTTTETSVALPPIVDAETWRHDLDELRTTGEGRHPRARRHRRPATTPARWWPCRTTRCRGRTARSGWSTCSPGRRQLITYHHMWSPGAEWQCGGCTGFTSQFTRLDFLTAYDARFVIVTQGPIDEALAYKEKVGNRMTWYSTADSPFGADVDAPPGGGFAVNVFLRDGDTVYRTWHTERSRHRAAQPHLPADRPAAVGPSGAVAGLTGRLAAVADVRGLARLPGHRQVVRPRADRGSGSSRQRSVSVREHRPADSAVTMDG